MLVVIWLIRIEALESRLEPFSCWSASVAIPASSTSTFCYTTYTTFDYCRVVADILLPLLSTVERDFVAINVRVNPTTERKVMACIRFDTPPLTLRLSLSLLMHLRCF